MIQRFDPNLLTNFETGQVLQNNSHRFYCTSRKSSYESHIQPNIIDWNVDELSMQTWFAEDIKFGYPLLSGAYKLFLIALPNDDAIVVANIFNCDFGGTDIVYVTSDQQTKWYLPGHDIDPYPYEINEIGIVDKDVLALIMEGEETLYIDFDGVQRTYDIEPDIYTHMFYQDQSIYGYRDHHWYQLDTAFQVVHSIEVDTITFICALGHHLLLQTNEELFLVDESLNVLYGNVDLKNIHGACSINTGICIISDDHVYFVDSTIQVIQEFASLAQEKLQYVAASGDTAFVLSQYDGLKHSDFVIREYVMNEVTVVPALDLRFNSLILPDTVFIYNPLGEFWSNQLIFDTVFLNITNNSTDTIHKFRVECDWSPIGVVMCTDYQKTWDLDQLLFLPGETRIFKLNPFRTDSITYGYHSPFCFWIESPNGLPDIDPTDNSACDATRLTVGTELVESKTPLDIYPNPAGDFVIIEMEKATEQKLFGSIYNLMGNRVQNFEMRNQVVEIPVTDLASGLYFIVISNSKGSRTTKKILLQH
ncbi:MAG: T9SS type A sorting domain-containing protein [Saprospiraceae bacterium]